MKTMWVSCFAVLGLVMVLSGPIEAGQQSLVRIEKRDPGDRNALLAAGIPLVEEMSHCFLAVGDSAAIAAMAKEAGRAAQVVETDMAGYRYAIAGLWEGAALDDVAHCGGILLHEEQWALLKASSFDEDACVGAPGWFLRQVNLDAMKPTRPLPQWMTDLAEGRTTLQTKPLVADMVAMTTDDLAMSHWQAIVNESTTRYSSSQGCQDAADLVFDIFDSLGLNPELQSHTGGYAPNIVGTLPGVVDPTKVYILIGHLDDMPSSGPAPGADDNASGAAMVAAAAEVMSGYGFAYTLRFLVVTGEEQGLHGSTYYASQALASGEDIQAVLNADMIGWEGNGSPNPENLDLNVHSSWPELGSFFAQAAVDYGTGCVVDAFICDSMTASDHAPFWSRGYPAVFAITDNHGSCGHTGTYPYYHQSSDTIANCGPGAEAFEGAAVRAFLAAAAHMADPICARSPAPGGLVATAGGDNQIDLSWSSAGPDLTYEVYRAAGGCSDPTLFEKVGETTALAFSDTGASGGVLHAYHLRAKHSSGYCLSEPSTCAEATTTGSCTQAPDFSGVVSVTNQQTATCQLEVEWNPVDRLFCGSTATYNVYRSDSSGFTPSLGNQIASGLIGTIYLDTSDLVFDTRYYYIVRAVDSSNGVEESNTAEAWGVPTGAVAIGTWVDDAGDTGQAKLDLESPWSVAAGEGVGGSAGYKTGHYTSNLCAGAVTPELRLGSGSSLSFFSKYDIETDWDKGEVEVSTDGGSTWDRVPVNYPLLVSHSSDACGLASGQNYFNGSSSSYSEYTASLAGWAGETVLLRWVLSSDGYIEEDGWWIDDIEITNVEVPSSCSTAAQGLIFDDDFESGDTTHWSHVQP
jgi:hypothetical protein